MAYQQNVQQQNDEMKSRLLATARYWREKGLPVPLQRLLRDYEINPDGLVVLAHTPGDLLGHEFLMEFLILTETADFLEIRIELAGDGESILEVEKFEDVTADQNLSEHNRGLGQGEGYLALQILEELNSSRTAVPHAERVKRQARYARIFNELYEIEWPPEITVETLDGRSEQMIGDGYCLVPPGDDPDEIGYLSGAMPKTHPRSQFNGLVSVSFKDLKAIFASDGRQIWPPSVPDHLSGMRKLLN